MEKKINTKVELPILEGKTSAQILVSKFIKNWKTLEFNL